MTRDEHLAEARIAVNDAHTCLERGMTAEAHVCALLGICHIKLARNPDTPNLAVP